MAGRRHGTAAAGRTHFDSGFYVPSTEYVTPTSANVQAAFLPVVVRP
ncbi:hypothetical protein ACIBG5_21795 [Kribbella sp. NPDC050241]